MKYMSSRRPEELFTGGGTNGRKHVNLRGSRCNPAHSFGYDEFQSFGAFRPDRDNIRDLRVPFLYRNLLPAIFKSLQEVRIFPSSILDVVPTENLVVARRNSSQEIMSILIGGCFLEETRLIPVRLVRHQHDPHPCDRKVVLVRNGPLNASATGADGYLE